MIFFSQKYQGTPVQVLIAFNDIYFPCKDLVFLLLAEYYLNCVFKDPTIMNSYQFLNVPSHEWHNWKVYDGSSILSGLVVKVYNNK